MGGGEAAQVLVSGSNKDRLFGECSLGSRELAGKKPAEMALEAWSRGTEATRKM